MNQFSSLYSEDTERMILGIALTAPKDLDVILTEVSIQDFYIVQHKCIFESISKVVADGKVPDTYLVYQEILREGKKNECGGIDYIVTLAQFAGISADASSYIQELKDYSLKRRINELKENLSYRLSKNEDPQKIISELGEKCRQIENSQYNKDKITILFLNQFKNNFLITTPPRKKMLLNVVDENGKSMGFLPKGIVAMLVGAGGTGKTHLLAQLAVSIATGMPWLEVYTPEEEYGSVFFGLGENDYDDIHRVLYKAAKKFRSSQESINEDVLSKASQRIAAFSFSGQQAAFIEKGHPTRYFNFIKSKLIESAPLDGWSLIIFDPVSRLLGTDAETDNASATLFIALLEELARDLPGNPTILFAHHVNKSALQATTIDQSSARGSSALTDGVRWQVNLSRVGFGLVLKMTKSNFTESAKEKYLRQDFEGHFESMSEIPQLDIPNDKRNRKKPKESSRPPYMRQHV